MASKKNGSMPPSGYATQLAGFRESDAARDALVEEILKQYEDLKVKFEERDDDYNNERESRRMWQNKAATLEVALAQHKQVSVSNNFALLLVDGDGAIFQEYLYAKGKDGGAEAAHQLHSELQDYLRSIYPDANVSDWHIVVQVILNLHGLANKLISCGYIFTPNELQSFGRAFGLAQPLFSFVDVGEGKERADHKIRETLRLYLPLAQCKHVFFAPCHDNGYLPVLEPCRRDTAMASRITLVETRPAEPGFVDLGFNRIRFPQIFRSGNLPFGRNPPMMSPASAPKPTPTPGRTLSASHGNSTSYSPNTARTSSPAPSNESTASAGNSHSWATVGKANSGGKSINIAPKKNPTRRFILVNSYGDRIDPELPRTDPGAESRFAEKWKIQGKCCNNYHLTGKCDAGEYCDYFHGQTLSPGELLVLKHKARSRSCPLKLRCRDFDCTFGHNCKFGHECNSDYCYFSDTHNMDFVAAKRIYQDGTEERIR